MKNVLLNIGFWNRNRFFWLFHTSGWLLIFLLVYGLIRDGIFDIGGFYRLSTYYIAGFILTAVLRYRLRKLEWRDSSIFRLLGLVIGLAAGLSFLIYLIHLAASIPTLNLDLRNSAEPLRILWDLFNKFLFTWHTIIITMVLIVWLVLYFGLKFYIDLSVESDRAEKALVQAQQAQLEMLRYQINPHFLFNALNSIWALVEEDPKSTKNMINELSDFLRYSLLYDNKAFKPLGHEIEALKNYFALEKKRFQDKLIVKFDIDPRTEGNPVLSFLLQPFVENAIKFGMQTSEMPLRITISSKVKGDFLYLTVSNTGYWIDHKEGDNEESFFNGTGMGLENAKKRLLIAYPKQHSFNIIKEDSKVTVEIAIRNKKSDG